MFKIQGWLIIWICILISTGCSGNGSYMMKRQQTPEITEKHFHIYDSAGSSAAIEDIIKSASKANAVFIGEEHDDPAAHFLEADILKRLYDAQRSIVLSMEMFERDIQVVLDEYLKGLISERHFLIASRPWPRYGTDYRPMIEFAKENKIPVIAANAPGRYVNRVSRKGRDALNDLSPSAKSWLPPLPYGQASQEYTNKFKDFWEKHRVRQQETGKENGQDQPDFQNFIDAQCLWDSSMAFSMAQALKENPEVLVLNINGKFHSAGGLGTPEQLQLYLPDLKICTITILSEESFPDFSDKCRNEGDFVIITDPKLRPPVFIHPSMMNR